MGDGLHPLDGISNLARGDHGPGDGKGRRHNAYDRQSDHQLGQCKSSLISHHEPHMKTSLKFLPNHLLTLDRTRL